MTFRRFSPTDPATLATLLNRLGDDLTEDISTAAGSASWASITGKPTRYPSTDHQHALADVDGLTAALAGKVDDDDARLTNARTPTAHQHAVADVDGLTARLAAIEQDTKWRDVSSELRNGATGTLHIRRVGLTVHWRVKNFISGTSHDFYIPPPGFIATTDANVYAATIGSTTGAFYRHMNGRLCRSIYDTPVTRDVWWEGTYILPPGTPPVTTPIGNPA